MNACGLLGSSLILLACGVTPACAQSVDTGNEALFELQVTGYAGHGKGSSLLATALYVEKPLLVQGVSVFAVVHHDREFRAVYAGLARKFGDLQLGLGFGNAWYEDRRHPTVNPWLYYAGDAVEAFVSAERYGREDREPWFYKGQANWRVADSIFVGAYGEKDLGVGPLLAWRNGNVRIWGAIPVVSRPGAGARGVAGVQVEF